MSHIKGEQAVNLLKKYFPDSWVVREYTPDYGIDLMMLNCSINMGMTI